MSGHPCDDQPIVFCGGRGSQELFPCGSTRRTAVTVEGWPAQGNDICSLDACESSRGSGERDVQT